MLPSVVVVGPGVEVFSGVDGCGVVVTSEVVEVSEVVVVSSVVEVSVGVVLGVVVLSVVVVFVGVVVAVVSGALVVVEVEFTETNEVVVVSVVSDVGWEVVVVELSAGEIVL